MRILRICGGVAVGVAMVILTASRVHVWGEPTRVWMDAIAAAPQKPRPWVNLGHAYQMSGQLDLAADAYQHALVRADVRPPDEQHAAAGVARMNLALLAFQHGDRVAARTLAQIAIEHLPQDPSLHRAYRWITATE